MNQTKSTGLRTRVRRRLVPAVLAAVAAVCASPAAVRAGDKSVGLTLQNPLAFAREGEPLSCGVPLAKGFVAKADELVLLGPDGKPVPAQIQVTGRYPDGTPRWVLLDLQANVPATGQAVYRLSAKESGRAVPRAKLSYTLANGVAEIDTGAARFRIDTKRFRLFDSVKIDGVELIGKADGQVGGVLEDEQKRRYAADQTPAKAAFEDAGPMRVTLCVRGGIGPMRKHAAGRMLPLTHYVCRMHFHAGKSEVRVFFTLHNPGAHNHPGNIWELGAGGSVFMEDFSLVLPLAGGRGEPTPIVWTYGIGGCTFERQTGGRTTHVALPTILGHGGAPLKIYQDSSGGRNWRSANHVDKDYKVPVTFRGYRVHQGDAKRLEGHRARPFLLAWGLHRKAGVAVALREFWQNFPKALAFRPGALNRGGRARVALWPREFAGVHELLGGEQKTHEMLFVFHGTDASAAQVESRMKAFHSPMYAMPDPEAVLDTGAFWLTAPLNRQKYGKLEETCDAAVHPRGGSPKTILNQWETIDEYGWRHFGDTFADNEPAPAAMIKAYPEHHVGRLAISHYVNEYEVYRAFLLHGIRRADPKWLWAFDVMARHHADICIYHTDVGSRSYGHGPFFHTTHDTAAYRSTHRSYPIEAKRYKLQYGRGGGPNAGHTYVTCLAQHYYLTGDRNSREAFLEVAEGWVLGSSWFRRAGMGDRRGLGNFLATLVAAYRLTGRRKFYDGAMKVVGWADPPQEGFYRGLYATLFCKAGADFLNMKREAGELDDDYRAVLGKMLMYGDHYLKVARKDYGRYVGRHCGVVELLATCYLYAPANHPNREAYFRKARQVWNEAADKWPGRYMSCKNWVICFSNTGAFMKAEQVHAAEADRPNSKVP
jgi:hypothetical protein